MPTSVIKVSKGSTGKPVSNARVVLEWGGIANCGQTPVQYTNSNGEVVINHASSGKATVYVNGKRCNYFHAPGHHTEVI